MLSIDLDGLEDKVKPKLKSTMRYLKNAQNILYSINIPSDFAYNSVLRSMPRTISEINSEVNSNAVWVESVIENFDTVEGNNKGIFDEILQKAEEMCGIEDIFDYTQMQINHLIKMPGKLIDKYTDMKSEEEEFMLKSPASYQVYKMMQKTFGTSYTLKDHKDYMKRMKEEKSDPVGDAWNAVTGWVGDRWDDATEWLGDRWDDTTEWLGDRWDDAGCLVSDGLNWLMDETPIGTGVATFINAANAFGKGVLNLGESLVDIGAIGLTLANTVPGVRCISRKSCSIFTVYGIDLITYGSCLISGDVDEFESFATKQWNWTMSFVAEEHVNDLFDDYYDTSVGEWLDSHAWEPFRSDGIAFGVTEGTAYFLRYSSIIYSYWWFCSRNSRYGWCWRRSRILLGKAKRFFNGRY